MGGEEADALANYETIERELAAHDPRLASLPRVLALSKADLVEPERVDLAVAEWSRRLGDDVPVIATSSATGAGLHELAAELLQKVPTQEQVVTQVSSVAAPLRTGTVEEDRELELAEHMVFRPSAPGGFTVERTAEHSFAVHGRGVERLLQRYDVDNEDAMAYLETLLRKIGVLRALEAEGFQTGDDLLIAGVALELDPDEAA
jgi:GTP-binding protein